MSASPPNPQTAPDVPLLDAGEAARRDAFQRALGERLRSLSSGAEVVAIASEMLGRQLDVARVAYAGIDERSGTYQLRHEWTQGDAPRIVDTAMPMQDFAPEIGASLQAGQPVMVDDIAADPRTAAYARNYEALHIRASIAVPLIKPHGLVMVLGVHAAQPRAWTALDVALVQDVAERTWLAVQAVGVESELRETQSWLAAIFDSLPVGVGVFDTAGRVQLANRAMQLYMPSNELPSRDLRRLARWQGRDAQGQPLQPRDYPGARASRGERVVPGIEVLYTPDDGPPVWTEVAAVPIRDAKGNVTGQVSIVHEIDTLKRAEAAQRELAESLAEVNRRQTEFLAVLAHELRNPLAPILTALELVRVRPDSADIAARARDIVERQTRQMVHLIDDLLDIARVSSGKIEIRRERVDLHEAVATAVETSLPTIEKAGHVLHTQLHEGPLPLWANATRIAQIVSNLLTNAAKYTPRGGQILLSVEKDRDEAVVTVRDNGIGIPKEALGHVFDMFSQLQAGDGAAPGGLGIGLALVRQLVALMDGSVTASSDGVGLGSTFIVRLPLREMEPPRAAPPPARSDGPKRALRILVADDNVDAAGSLAALLAEDGHATLVAHDGPSALRAALEHCPDVVFLDIGMPGLTGYEVARRMRADPALRDAKLAAVTGWGTEADRQRAREAGFDAHFTKPVSAGDVAAFLQGVQQAA